MSEGFPCGSRRVQQCMSQQTKEFPTGARPAKRRPLQAVKHPFPNDPNRSERRRGRRWVERHASELKVTGLSFRVCTRIRFFIRRSLTGALHDRRVKRGGGTADKRISWPFRKVRNGNGRKAARLARHGTRDSEGPKRRGTFSGHKLPKDPKRGGHGNSCQDGTGGR